MLREGGSGWRSTPYECRPEPRDGTRARHEAAALAASRWVGKGDKIGADGAAVDAMRAAIDSVAMDGVVVIGEGEKDEAPMLFIGERVGTLAPGTPKVEIAVDPIDGTTLTSKGMPNAVSVIGLSEEGTLYDSHGLFYMNKLAVGPEAAGVVDISAPVATNLAQRREGEGDARLRTDRLRPRPPAPYRSRQGDSRGGGADQVHLRTAMSRAAS